MFAAASGQVEVIYAADGMPRPVSNGWTLQMEVLDVDAYTGGFNLQIAWSTGRLAGESAARWAGEQQE